LIDGKRPVRGATRLDEEEVDELWDHSWRNGSSRMFSLTAVDQVKVGGMGVGARPCALDHFSGTTCMVDMTVRENQMTNVLRIVPCILHRAENGIRFIRPSGVDQDQAIPRL
jgi:hypothetical protein